MPKIRINETDATGSVQASGISNVVFMPIEGTDSMSGKSINPVLFESVKQLQEELKPLSSSAQGILSKYGVKDNQLDFKICKHLLMVGFKVLVSVETGSENNLQSLCLNLADKGSYDIRFLTAGTKFTAANANLIACAGKRGDCVALLNLDESGDFSYDMSTITEQFTALGSSNGDYGAGFTPWFKSKAPDLIEGAKGGEVTIPAAYGYLFAYANAVKNNPEWYAIAGFERGLIPELSSLCHEYSSADIERLQARATSGETELDGSEDNIGVAINPIANVRPAGPIIYGNRTLRNNDASKKLIATSFLNVRNLVSAVKKSMYDASRKYTFEQNNEILWINFQAYVTPLLDRMQSSNGILGYKFIKQKTNAKARLKARLKLVPIEAVEDFDLEVYLTDDLNVSE